MYLIILYVKHEVFGFKNDQITSHKIGINFVLNFEMKASFQLIYCL